MLLKSLLFFLLWRLLGNPFLAILVLLVAFYFIDRRYIGLMPSFVQPFRRRSQMAKLRQTISLNPHDVKAKQDLARLLIEKKDYRAAGGLLESIGDSLDHSAEFWDDLGTVRLYAGDPGKGEESILRALDINPRVKYGQPYLRLASYYSQSDPAKALRYLQQFKEIHSSSCEAYYRLGDIYRKLGRSEQARQAYAEAGQIYATLPKYKKRQERKWALRSFFASKRA